MTLRFPATALMLACTLVAPLAATGDNAARTLYERAGFEYLRPKGLRNCVMRRSLR